MDAGSLYSTILVNIDGALFWEKAISIVAISSDCIGMSFTSRFAIVVRVSVGVCASD